MDATPALLPPHVVSLLLSYLSRLDDPLPPHLISTPLRQRHQFLGLGHVLDTTQDAAVYLSWPSSTGSEDNMLCVVKLLGALPSPENFDPLSAYPTKYSFDGEAVFAHTQIRVDDAGNNDSVGLRLVFRWEAADDDGVVHDHEGVSTNADNWKYHDAKPMPFPLNTHDSPQDALRAHSVSSPEDITPTRLHPSTSNHFAGSSVPDSHAAVINSDSDDDAYWDSYGRSNSDDEDGQYAYGRSRSTAVKYGEDEKAEEAYWAQYANVHGTADSARHSPLPQKRRLHDPNQPIAVRPALDYDYSLYLDRCGSHDFLTSEDAHHASAFDPYDVPENLGYLHRFAAATGRETSPDGVPCPEAIARRLHNLSPRVSVSPSPAPPEIDTDVIKLETLPFEKMESPGAVSPDTSDGRTLTPPGITETSSIPEIALSASSPLAEKGQDGGTHLGLQEAIRGMYRLWAGTREANESAPKDEFLSIVHDAIKTI